MEYKNKKIIWDLFGGGQNSVYNSLKKNDLLSEFEVYTFDITEPEHEHHYKVDLASDNIIEIFKKYPKPDIIVSSTLCQSFSCVLNMKGGGTCFWKYNNTKSKLIQRSIKEFEELKSGFTKHLKAETQLFVAKLGKKCIDNTIDLIKYYNPKFWYIENPKQSLIWKYIVLNRKDFYNPEKHFMNKCSYGKYGYLTTKATIFMSNIEMELKQGNIEPPYEIKQDHEGVKWYVLKDNPEIKMRRDLDSRMIGLSNIKTMIKARNAKSGMGAMDFVMRSSPSKKNRKNFQNEQLSEASPASAIPESLIFTIFQIYKIKKVSKK